MNVGVFIEIFIAF